jgi:hypothetical protein
MVHGTQALDVQKKTLSAHDAPDLSTSFVSAIITRRLTFLERAPLLIDDSLTLPYRSSKESVLPRGLSEISSPRRGELVPIRIAPAEPGRPSPSPSVVNRRGGGGVSFGGGLSVKRSSLLRDQLPEGSAPIAGDSNGDLLGVRGAMRPSDRWRACPPVRFFWKRESGTIDTIERMSEVRCGAGAAWWPGMGDAVPGVCVSDKQNPVYC